MGGGCISPSLAKQSPLINIVLCHRTRLLSFRYKKGTPWLQKITAFENDIVYLFENAKLDGVVITKRVTQTIQGDKDE
jgi:hypothetical protein